MSQGSEIPIEERPAEELCCVTLGGRSHRVAAPAIGVWNPAFDVTPAPLITGIVTDRGLIAKRRSAPGMDPAVTRPCGCGA